MPVLVYDLYDPLISATRSLMPSNGIIIPTVEPPAVPTPPPRHPTPGTPGGSKTPPPDPHAPGLPESCHQYPNYAAWRAEVGRLFGLHMPEEHLHTLEYILRYVYMYVYV